MKILPFYLVLLFFSLVCCDKQATISPESNEIFFAFTEAFLTNELQLSYNLQFNKSYQGKKEIINGKELLQWFAKRNIQINESNLLKYLHSEKAIGMLIDGALLPGDNPKENEDALFMVIPPWFGGAKSIFIHSNIEICPGKINCEKCDGCQSSKDDWGPQRSCSCIMVCMDNAGNDCKSCPTCKIDKPGPGK